MRLNKKAQIESNKEVLTAVNRYNEEVKETILHHGTRLRTCQAYVYETPSFYVQFDECDSIDYTLGLVRIFVNNEFYEYKEDVIKELIFVNDHTRSYAIELGYEA